MRAINRLVATILSIAVLAAAVIIVVEVVLAAIGHKPYLFHWHGVRDALTRNTWRDLGVQVTGVVLILVGLFLLVIGLKRGRPDVLKLADSGSGATVTTTRKSLQRALKAATVGTDGVEKAKVSIRRRKIKIDVRSPMLEAAPVQRAVEAKATRLLDGVELAKPLRIKTNVKLRTIERGV